MHKRALEEQAISELAKVLYILPTDLVLVHPQTLRLYPDTLRHNPDTPRQRLFYAIQDNGIKDNI